jgi:hypothetical protein
MHTVSFGFSTAKVLNFSHHLSRFSGGNMASRTACPLLTRDSLPPVLEESGEAILKRYVVSRGGFDRCREYMCMILRVADQQKQSRCSCSGSADLLDVMSPASWHDLIKESYLRCPISIARINFFFLDPQPHHFQSSHTGPETPTE